MNGSTDRIFLDIETLPALGMDEDERRERVAGKVPRSIKKATTREKWIEENSTKVWRDTALDSHAG